MVGFTESFLLFGPLQPTFPNFIQHSLSQCSNKPYPSLNTQILHYKYPQSSKLSIHPIMNSPNKPRSKASRLARMTEKPVWRRKSPRNKSIITNDIGSHSIPPTSYFPNFTSNPQGHSFDPLYKPYNIGQPSNYNSNYTNPNHSYQTYDPLHIATEKQTFRDEINQIHDLSDLLAMHLAQRNKG